MQESAVMESKVYTHTGNGRGQTQFPPPCSWYQSHLADARNELWAYSSLNGIVIVRPADLAHPSHVESVDVEKVSSNIVAKVDSDENEVEKLKPTSRKIWPEFTFLEVPQGGKVTSVSFCKVPWSELPIEDSPLVSACEGGVVRIWSLKTNSTNMYNDAHKGNPALVEWSPRDPFLIYTIDSQGNLSVWNLKKSSLKSMNFGKIGPTCIAVSPHEDDIIAIGTRAGHILLIEATEKGKILYKMRHDEEVFCVSWKPNGVWGAIEDSKSFTQPYLISSVASLKPPTIRVWDRHGKDVAIIRPWERDTKERKLYKSFVPTSWAIEPSGGLILVSSGLFGELIGWSDSCTTPDIIHDIHNNYTIFAGIQSGDILWSLSYEPVIVGWNLREGGIECVIPTFKGVSSVMSSPIDISRLAFGGMDGCIRILSVGDGYPEMSPLKSPTVTNRLKGKITALAWHPYRENLVGFGTDEGVIGVYEWKADNKFAMMFDRRINGTVYTVDFGPHVYTEEFQLQRGTANEHIKEKGDDLCVEKEPRKANLMLYACGGQSVFMISTARSNSALISVTKVIQKTNLTTRKHTDRSSDSTSEIKWTPDLSYFAVGYNDGRIEIYSPPFLQMRCSIHCHTRGIQFFAWRAQDFLPESESQGRWFASASNDGTARLFNLSQLFSEDFQNGNEVVQIISSVATLNGHGGMRVICLAWSPHDDNILVTVSYDRTAVVWNTKDGRQIARYSKHQHRLVTCVFHPTDKYKVITASDEIGLDFSIHVWDYRHYPCTVENKKYKLIDLIPQNVEPIKAELTLRRVNGQDQSNSTEGLKMTERNIIFVQSKPGDKSHGKGKSKSIMPMTSNALINTKHSLNEELRCIVDKIPIQHKKGEIPVQQIPKECPTLKLDNDIKFQTENGQLESTGVMYGSSLHLSVLGTGEDASRLITAEQNLHVQNESWDYATQLGNWLGDPVKTIQQAMKLRQLTETMVAMASTYSKTLYYDAVQALAIQFYEKDEHLKAVTYMLLIDKVEEALEMLVKKKCYREAVLLAKCRLPEELPQSQLLITDIQEKWIAKLVNEGNYELACKINCSLGRFGEALANIEKRNLPYAWKGALYVAVKADDLKKAEVLGVKYLEDRMTSGDYDECSEIMTEFNFLKWMMPIVLVHKNLADVSRSDLPLGDEHKDRWDDVLSTFGKETEEKWKASGILKEDPVYKTKIKSLLQLAIAQNYKEAILIIAKNVTLMILEGSEGEDLVGDCEKLAQTWLEKEKNCQILAQAVVTIVRKLSS